jgi:hypothetical protein
LNENIVYGVCSCVLIFVVSIILYSYFGNPPPPPLGSVSDDSFKSLVVQNLANLSEDTKTISDKIDELIEITEPVEVVKNVLLEWKFN